MSDLPLLDDRTIGVIRAAVSAATAGRLTEACAIGMRGLAQGCDSGALHAMIGSFLLRSGDFEPAIGHLRQAHALRPQDPLIAKSLATAHLESGRSSEALSVLTSQLAARDPTRELWRLRGFAGQQVEDFEVAVEAYERVIEAHPTDWRSWNNLGNARESAGDVAGAIDALGHALRLNPGSAEVRFNLALALYGAGDLAHAETHLRLLVEQAPGDHAALGYLFRVLKEQGWDSEARELLKTALERDPHNVALLIQLGRELLLAFDLSEAAECFTRALDRDPGNGDAYFGLADVLDRRDPAALPALLDRAREARVPHAAAEFIRAIIAFHERRYLAGAEALRNVPDDCYPVRRWHLAGQFHDRLGDSDAAFDAFVRMNEIQAQDPTRPLLRAAELRRRLEDRLAKLTREWQRSWSTPPIPHPSAPVFLVGFPRSGTTLLDTMLMGHPEIAVMEERPALHQLELETGGFDSLARMDGGDVRRAQERYFEIAGKHAPIGGARVLVDKSPLHMHKVPQICRLFPNARFILALRHPADAVLSCFMARFRMNWAMANFLELGTAAEFYDLSFRLWNRSLEIFPVEVHPIAYEQVIADPEGVLRPLVEALGLAWRPELLDHQRTAKARGPITTASYAQVTQPLYREAAGRWTRYRDRLDPVLPLLAPWIEQYGYAA